MERRGRIGGRKDLVGAVAVPACRRGGISGLQGQGMHAGVVAFGQALVTTGAVDRLGGDIVIGMFVRHVAVATGAGVGAVGRGFQPGGVHVERLGLAVGIGLGEGLVLVAKEAIAVLRGFGCL